MNLELFSPEDNQNHEYPQPSSGSASREERLAAIYHRCRGTHHATQTQRLALALKELKSVSTYECRRHLDIYCPPARKYDLIKQGYRIKTHRQTVRVENGGEHRVGVYVLA
ncbi:helix-turn-helix domain-containing protein [Cupriavidus malaysiensis]|uniref:helix-turn-helix domain-containing protein n=1 Tax=Cupriavidus malaysiensis TaxID=367825 RepID=UPI0012FFB5BA|nr:helix-turn-helix domain-containing protein [Cupriavidus malaysiensis]